MNDIIVILKQVIAKHPEAMNDQDIIKPLLRKAFFHDKLSGNVLGLIFESGIVDIALLLGNIPAQRLKFYVDSFVNEFGMRPYIAKKYVIIWLQALDIEYEEYEDEEDEYEYIWISGNEKTDESDDEEEYDEDEESDGADEEYDEDDESDNVEEEYDEDDESDDVDEEYDDDEESDDVEEECDEDDESDDVDEEYDEDDESDNVEEEYDEDDESDDVEEEYDEDDESDDVEEEYDEDEESDGADEEYDEDDESDDVEEEYDEDDENEDVDEEDDEGDESCDDDEYEEDDDEDSGNVQEEYNEYENNDDVEEEYEEDDEVEEDMRIHYTSSSNGIITETYDKYPLLGNRILPESTKIKLYDNAIRYVNEYLNGRTEEFSLKAKRQITIAVINFAQNWDYNDESKFWKYIAEQLGYKAKSEKIRSFLTSCVKEVLHLNNRLFIGDESRNFYKTTIMAHALAPKSGWLRLCDFLYELYLTYMKCEYTSNDDNIKVLVDAINKQLKSNDADDIDALYFENESYYFGEGLRKLFILRPRFMRKILDYMLEKIHTILQGEELIETKYIDVIINEWHNNLKNGTYNVNDNAKKYEIKRSFTPKYALENDADVIIRCSDTWLPHKDFDSLELEIYINDGLVKSQSLKFYDSPNGRILVKFTVNIDDYLKCDDNILLSRLVVFADEERIFDYELNSRRMLCFKGDREIRPEDLRQGDYLFFVVNGHNLEFENTADETDIDLSNASKWEKAVYAELDADFKVWLDDELIAFDDPSKTFSDNSNIRKNLDNLATAIETDFKNLAEIPIRDARGEKWPPKQYMWMSDINRREIVTVSYPTSNPCELWVGDKKVALRKGKFFALGETVAKFSPRTENSWIDVTLRRGVEIYILCRLTKKERFIKSVVMKYNIEENAVKWNMGGGFVGENDGEFRLIIYSKNATVYDELLDLTEEIAVQDVNLAKGRYKYKIVKRINDMWGDKEILLYDGRIIIGDKDALRFQGKRIKINKIVHYLNDKVKTMPDSIKEVFIDNLTLLNKKHLENGKKERSIYKGTMFYMNNDVRIDFSESEDFKTDEKGQETVYKVNPVTIMCFENNKIIMVPADGSHVHFCRKYNRKEGKNYYQITDTIPDVWPKHEYYGDIAYCLYSVEEEE